MASKENSKQKMKTLLMVQSLSPLALLTIINNFSFVIPPIGQNRVVTFIECNRTLIIVMILCAVWTLVALWSYLRFSASIWVAGNDGYEIHELSKMSDASLNFFMTLIIPLLIDNVGTARGAITLGLIIIMMYRLLAQTSLFYANPILTLLGYRVYEFKFTSYKEGEVEETCIGITRSELNGKKLSVTFWHIADNVYFLKRR